MNEHIYETFKLSDNSFRICLEIVPTENKETNSSILS